MSEPGPIVGHPPAVKAAFTGLLLALALLSPLPGCVPLPGANPSAITPTAVPSASPVSSPKVAVAMAPVAPTLTGGMATGTATGTALSAAPYQLEVSTQREGRTIPLGCSPEVVARAVEGFLDGFNRGDQAEIERYLDLDGFSGFYVGGLTDGGELSAEVDLEGETNRAEARQKLLAYLAQRRVHHESLGLKSLQLGPEDPNLVTINYYLERNADDLQLKAAGQFGNSSGKGVFDCARGKIVRWVYDGQDYLTRPM